MLWLFEIVTSSRSASDVAITHQIRLVKKRLIKRVCKFVWKVIELPCLVFTLCRSGQRCFPLVEWVTNVVASAWKKDYHLRAFRLFGYLVFPCSDKFTHYTHMYTCVQIYTVIRHIFTYVKSICEHCVTALIFRNAAVAIHFVQLL